ncbi:hypothetical protein [uncultured Aquimarina sp.]|uniref:hypothetical protein n=1 Tax=uncultured Aquimarina sp. TaxID=575652 RepID=UPI00260AC985|nr:hypothetical protein [uncultured Aquimarina sp.]
MIAGNLIKQKAIFPLILIQIISSIWYLLPSVGHSHVPGGFIRMLIFGGITLVLLVITTILYFMYKPTGIFWKISFMISLGMILLVWFYSK